MTLTEQLQQLINERANEKLAKISGNVQDYKDWIEGLDETLNTLIQESKEEIANLKEDGLTLNSIESEGFLRGVLHVQSQINSEKKWIVNLKNKNDER